MKAFGNYEQLYVVVDRGICTACGACSANCPEVFAEDNGFIAYNRLDDNTGTVPVPEVLWPFVHKTRSCQTKAIKYSDTPFDAVPHTREFDSESPLNPKITYQLAEHEYEANEE